MDCEWAKLEVVFSNDCCLGKIYYFCYWMRLLNFGEEWLEDPRVRVRCVFCERTYICVID